LRQTQNLYWSTHNVYCLDKKGEKHIPEPKSELEPQAQEQTGDDSFVYKL